MAFQNRIVTFDYSICYLQLQLIVVNSQISVLYNEENIKLIINPGTDRLHPSRKVHKAYTVNYVKVNLLWTL